MTRLLLLSLCFSIALCSVAGCGEADTPTSPTADANAPQIVLFTGRLPVGGSRFYSFTVSEAGTASLMLASLARDANGPALPASVALGLGVPRGIDCATTSSVTTGAALTVQISVDLQPGIYCARIADIGALTEPVAFAVRIAFP